jgi:probable O-glycosylation ligase (exosortase A-associated)
VRDLLLVTFITAIALMGLRRPFLLVLGYIYIDIVSPQRLSYYLLNSIPISLIFFIGAFAGWALNDDKTTFRFSKRQILILLLLTLAGYTTFTADFPVQALDKWDWVWKALLFAMFMPMVLYTRLRIESTLAFMLVSLGAIVIVGGGKTLMGGGGYGTLNLMVSNNSGLYEGSIISAVAVCVIPLCLYMAKHSTIFPKNIFTKIYFFGLAFACMLIPVGTQARTGLLCLALMVLLELRATKRRFTYLAVFTAIALAAIPLLPKSYFSRMDTIAGYKGDSSASTRIAVWKWTLNYVQDHPLGGGFNCFLQNKLTIDLSYKTADGVIVHATGYDAGRAFHNSYFEMLGEQGYPGLLMFLILHLGSIFRMEVIRRRYRDSVDEHDWVSPLAAALQHGHLIYLLGASFVGIAFQPFIYLLVAVEIGFDRYVQTYVNKRVWNPFRKRSGGGGEAEPDDEEPIDASAERLPPKPRWGREQLGRS